MMGVSSMESVTLLSMCIRDECACFTSLSAGR